MQKLYECTFICIHSKMLYLFVNFVTKYCFLSKTNFLKLFYFFYERSLPSMFLSESLCNDVTFLLIVS